MTTIYRTLTLRGRDIFVREAGPLDAPALLLLHGFPSSSRMYERLLSSLSDEFRLIAPDYLGFGHSSAPSPRELAYTFDGLADHVEALVDALALRRYVLYMADYGGPVGLRVAMRRPESLRGMIVQNAVAHEEGLGPLWEKRRPFWNDRARHEARLRANLASLEANRLRHIGTSPHPERYDPDLWVDETAFLQRPGQLEIQTELFYDYRHNVAAYPVWQRWMREHQPHTLVLWGRHDPSFTVAGARAYQRDLPAARLHILDAGHFALDEAPEEVARLSRTFLRTLPG